YRSSRQRLASSEPGVEMTVLIVAEHDNTTLSERTARCLTAARQIGEGIDLLIAGNACAAVAEAAARLGGVTRVRLAEHPALADHGPEVMAELILSIAASYDAICAPNSSMGKATLPRVAARLDVMQVSDIVEVISPDTFSHPIYAGNAIETVQCAAT